MMFKLLCAVFAVSASAYVPAMAPGSQLGASKIASSQYAAPMPVAPRSAEPTMSAVTERDADGNPVTHFDMIDPIYLAIVSAPWLFLLVTNPF